MFAFDLLTAGVDAHAKNHSLLHVGKTTRLAPAYDLISAHGIWPDERVRYRAAAAVKYGKERAYRRITSRNLMRTADVLGVSRESFTEALRLMSHGLAEAFQEAVDQVPRDMVTPLLRDLAPRVAAFAAGFVEQIQHDDMSYRHLPRFEGARAVVRPTGARVWQPGEWRNGRWATGRYRGRAR